MYLGDIVPGQSLYFFWGSAAVAGESITRATNGTISVYKDDGDTQSTTGITDTEDADTTTGLHRVKVDTSADGTFYAAGHDFAVILTGAVIDGKTTNTPLAHFSIANRSALRPTTAGRTLDVSTTGEAGIDWANVGSPTTTVGLSGTTVKTATDVETDTQDIQSRLPTALVSGRMDSSVGAVATGVIAAASFASGALDAVWSTATRLLTAGTNIVLAKGTGVTGFNDLSAAQVNAEADTALADYDGPTHAELTAELATADDATLAAIAALNNLDAAGVRAAVGLASANLDTQLAAIDDAVDTEVAAILAAVDTEVAAIKAKTDNLPSDPADQSGVEAAITAAVAGLALEASVATVDSVVDAIKLKTDALPSDPADQSAVEAAITAAVAGLAVPGSAMTLTSGERTAVADALLDRDMSTGTDSGSATVRTVRQALRALRNKVAVIAGTATIYAEDDTTASWTAAVTTTAGDPISTIDPASS